MLVLFSTEISETFCFLYDFGCFCGLPFVLFHIPYFFGYKTEFFSFQYNPKNLDPSYKTDLDLWHWFGRVKLVL